MKKWLWLAVAVLAALLAWTAAGPYRTVNAIRDAAQARDAQAMAEQVDFPALRSSLKAQLGDRLLREVGTPSPDNPFAAFGLRDRKSTRLTPVTNAHLVCRLLLEKK